MPSENYRYYCLDGAGHLHDAAWFHAENDADAIRQIEAKHPGDKCEIWQGKRLVAKLTPEPHGLGFTASSASILTASASKSSAISSSIFIVG